MPTPFISGVAAATVGRHPVAEHELIVPILLEAVADAGLELADIDGIVLSHPRIYTKQRYFANFVTDHLRMTPDAILMEVMGDGLTGALAVRQGALEVSSGNAKAVLVAAVSIERHVPTAEHLAFTLRALCDVDFELPFGPTAMAFMAMETKRYMHEYGATLDDIRQVSIKNRLHASMNPIAQFRDKITLDEIKASPPITDPLTLLDAAPRSDGAAAVVVTAGPRGDRPVEVAGVGFAHDGIHTFSDRPTDMLAMASIPRAVGKALAMAGHSLGDIDVAEIYAPCPIHEILATEAVGWFKRGECAAAAATGVTRFDGERPINTSGGCQSRGHPPLATPIYDVIEIVLQLRGEAGGRQVNGASNGFTVTEMGMYNGALSFALRRS